MFGSKVGKKNAKNEQETEPERIVWLKKCTDMLLAGGYFRARISALSPFDRVIGGLVWSITASNVDVEVDIIFEENSTLGQRLRLSSQVVRSLIKMKCPFRLEPHQIQGLDYPMLFPVIQWLVRKVIETRLLTGDLVRALSESQFSKSYTLPQDIRQKSVIDFTENIVDQYRPQRKFRRKVNASFKNEVARVEATLLEYGEQFYRAETESTEEEGDQKEFSDKRNKLLEKFGGKKEPSREEKKKLEEEARKKAEMEEKERLEGLKQNLSAVEGGENVSITGFIPSAEIDDFEERLKREEEELKENELPSGKRGQAQYKRQVEAYKKRITEKEEELAKAQSDLDAAVGNSNKLRASVDSRKKYNQKCVTEREKLEEVEKTHEKRHLLPQLKALVMLNENLKKQEAQFKNTCLEQKNDIMNLINGVEIEEQDEETKRMLEIEAIYDQDLAKLNRLRQVLAKKNQEIARIVRQIDDIPTRAELIQYERRFVELYELVAEKLVETRKYYAMYNTLEETHSYINHEVSLLESVNENFPQSTKSKAGMTHFLESFGQIVDGLSQNHETVKADFDLEVEEREKLKGKYAKLVEKQRKYFKAVKEFQEECYKNEKISEAIAKLQGS